MVHLKNGPNPASFCFFLLFSHAKYWTNTINEKSKDGVLGTQTRGGKMVGADKSTELWRHLEANHWRLNKEHLLTAKSGREWSTWKNSLMALAPNVCLSVLFIVFTGESISAIMLEQPISHMTDRLVLWPSQPDEPHFLRWTKATGLVLQRRAGNGQGRCGSRLSTIPAGTTS